MRLPLLDKKLKNNSYDSYNFGLAEAHYLWHILKAKYDFLQLIDIWSNQAHEQDLLILMKVYTTEIRKDVKLWEYQLQRVGVRGPDGYTPAMDTVGTPQLIGLTP